MSLPKARHGHQHDDAAAYVAHCTAVLRAAGARITAPRLAVMECLARSHEGVTPKELLETVGRRKAVAPVDQVTVYRILERFTALGLAHKLPNGTFVPCAHEDTAHAGAHVFTHCRACGKVAESHVPDEMLQPLLWYIRQREGFEGALRTIQIEGRCRDCPAEGE